MYSKDALRYVTPGGQKALNRPSDIPCTVRRMTKAEEKKYNVTPKDER